MQALSYYLDHFGLEERPFSLTPDPEFLFWSPEHRGALAMLEYGQSTRAPITLLTGEIGAGKTTLMHHFIGSLDEDVTIGLISNPRPGVNDILRRVCATLSLKGAAGEDSAEQFTLVQDFLQEEHRQHRGVLMIIDEAQNLSREALEDLRMLTNINAGKEEVLQLLLIGQPELRDMVRRPDLVQFAQRIAASYHIPRLSADGVAGYIAARLRAAGGSAAIFSRQAADLIFHATGGTPRLVNQLCDLSLTYAYAERAHVVKRAIVETVLRDGVFFAAGREVLDDKV